MVVIYTCIDGFDIPVQPGPLTRVYFNEHCEKGDRPGFYDFWMMETAQGSLTCRFLDGYPGQGFAQTSAAQTATLVPPSSAEEVEDWLNDPDHTDDAPCAQHGELNGKPITIGRNPVDAHYIVEAGSSPTEPSPS